jgi:hypothetical protein
MAAITAPANATGNADSSRFVAGAVAEFRAGPAPVKIQRKIATSGGAEHGRELCWVGIPSQHFPQQWCAITSFRKLFLVATCQENLVISRMQLDRLEQFPALLVYVRRAMHAQQGSD